MEILLLVVLILTFIASIVNVVVGLLIGSVVVQIMEILRSKPTNDKKQDSSEKPWYNYV